MVFLLLRGTETPEQVKLRILSAEKELEESKEVPHVLYVPHVHFVFYIFYTISYHNMHVYQFQCVYILRLILVYSSQSLIT